MDKIKKNPDFYSGSRITLVDSNYSRFTAKFYSYDDGFELRDFKKAR